MYCDHVSLGFHFMPYPGAYSWLCSVLLEGWDEISDHRGHRRTIVFSQPCNLDRHVLERDSQAFLRCVCHVKELAVGKVVDAIETERMARLARLLYAMPLLLRVGQTPEIRDRTIAARAKADPLGWLYEVLVFKAFRPSGHGIGRIYGYGGHPLAPDV